MKNNHDPARHLEYLRQTLSNNKNPLGFFLSAGCPLAVKMPEGKWPLIPDVAGLTKYITEQLSSPPPKKSKFQLLLEEVKKAGKRPDNIEDILSFLRGLKEISKGASDIRGFSEAELADLDKNICLKIIEKIKVQLPNISNPYHQFAGWVHSINRESPVEVFTTNYDLLIEQSFEEVGVPYFDGFVGSLYPFFDLRAVEDGPDLIPKHWTRLWKIHGSINWYQKDNNEVYRSTSLNEKDSHIIYPSHLKYNESRKMPYLALMDRLDSFLRKKGAILLMSGYSFNDEHINGTITSALKANPTAMVISLLFGKLASYSNALIATKNRRNLSLWAYDEAYIGGSRANWSVPLKNRDDLPDTNIASAIVTITDTIKAEDGTDRVVSRDELHLGDFSVMGNFLEKLIGLGLLEADDRK